MYNQKYILKLLELDFRVNQNLMYWYSKRLDIEYMKSDYNSSLRYGMQRKYEKLSDKINQLIFRIKLFNNDTRTKD